MLVDVEGKYLLAAGVRKTIVHINICMGSGVCLVVDMPRAQ